VEAGAGGDVLTTETKRPVSPGGEELIGKYFPVLDHGFVALVDYMGTDQCVERAARVSYGQGTRQTSETRGLLRYLHRHLHTTPSEMIELKFHCCMPLFVARQWIRHRTASVNEYSGRYSLMPMVFYTPEREQIQKQSTSNKQGRGEPVAPGVADEVRTRLEFERAHVAGNYEWMTSCDVARELARIDLPLSTYCYDAETEVLTDKGFVKWPLVTDEHKLGIWDNEKGTLCYERPEYRTRQRYSGDMYKVSHKSVDLMVTPNHKMWVALNAGKNFSLVPADQLGNRTLVRYSKIAPFAGQFQGLPGWFACAKSMAAMLRLIGFFLGDGHAAKAERNAILFTLRKTRKIGFLRSTCEELGLVCEERSGVHWVVRGEGISEAFKAAFYNAEREKTTPEWVRQLPSDAAIEVLNGMIASDGHSYGQGSCTFTSTSLDLVDAFVLLGIHSGKAINGPYPLTPAEGKNKAVYGATMLSDRCSMPVVNQMNANTSLVPYSGEVFCAKTRTGVLVVRRNGKVVLSGNTQWYWKIDLHNLLHFLTLRVDSHAQWEIQQYGRVMAGMLKMLAPLSYGAWIDYDVCGVRCSRQDMETLRGLLQVSGDLRVVSGAMTSVDIPQGREWDEFLAKLEPRAVPDFTLDLSKSMDASHFEALWNQEK
jgi:flavin-dependent thymidylate synthase